MFDSLLFLFFFTLHADQLHFPIGGYHIRLNNCLALALFALFFVRYRTRLFQIDPPLFLSLLLLTASLTLSFLLSPYKERCFFFLGWYGVTLFGYFLLPYLLVRYYDAKKVFNLYLISFLAVGLVALLQLLLSFVGVHLFATQFIAGRIVRVNALSYEPSYYALYMTPFIVLVNYHFLADRGRPFFSLGRLNYPKVLFINFLFFLSTATSAFFAFIIFCVGLFFLPEVRRHLLKFCLFFLSLFSLLALASPFLMKKYFLKFFYTGFMEHGSFYERWIGITNAWKVFLEHPLCGVGLGGYPPYLLDAILSGNPRYTTLVQTTFADMSNPLKPLEATNVCTEILASLGILGVLAFTLLLGIFIVRARRFSGLLISVIVMAIALQFNQGLFRTYVWVHLAIAFALITLPKIDYKQEPLEQTDLIPQISDRPA